MNEREMDEEARHADGEKEKPEQVRKHSGQNSYDRKFKCTQ